MSKDVFILGGKRTPMGEYVGVLKDISAIDLGATASKAAVFKPVSGRLRLVTSGECLPNRDVDHLCNSRSRRSSLSTKALRLPCLNPREHASSLRATYAKQHT